MNISYLGNFHDAHSTEGQIARAFERLGHAVNRLGVRDNDHDSIVAAVKESPPDILLGAKFQFRGADAAWPDAANAVATLIAECRPYIGATVCHHFDLVNPEFSPARFAWQQIVSEAVDLTCLTDGSVVPRLPRAVCVRDGSPDDIDMSFEPGEQINAVCFIGTLYGQRQDWARAMRVRLGDRFVHVGRAAKGYEPLGIPPNTEIRGPDLTRLVRSFRLCVQPPWPFFAGYASDRWHVLTAHGGLLVAPETPGMEADGWASFRHYLPAPRDFNSFAAKCREFLDCYDSTQIEVIRQAGQRHAVSKTWDLRVKELLGHLET